MLSSRSSLCRTVLNDNALIPRCVHGCRPPALLRQETEYHVEVAQETIDVSDGRKRFSWWSIARTAEASSMQLRQWRSATALRGGGGVLSARGRGELGRKSLPPGRGRQAPRLHRRRHGRVDEGRRADGQTQHVHAKEVLLENDSLDFQPRVVRERYKRLLGIQEEALANGYRPCDVPVTGRVFATPWSTT